MSDGEFRRTLCATGLMPVGTIAPDATGFAALVRSSTGGAATFFIIVGPLPDPATLGLATYDVLVVDPTTGVAVIRLTLHTLPCQTFGEGMWGGTASVPVDCKALPCGPVMVFASDINGLLGPQVAAGVLSDCD